MTSKSTNLLFSVITVVRNGRKFVEQTIESVTNQDYNNVEYIIVDGGSTDGTIEIIKSYGSKITKWISEKDEGIADAFNKGLSLSTGEYILFLNSDDALANPNVLTSVAQRIVENHFPILIYGDCNVLDRNSDKVLYLAKIQHTHKGVKRGKMIPHPSLFTHRSYFEKYGVFDNCFKIAMDYEWLLRGGLKETIVHMPLLVTCVRNGGFSTLDRTRVVDEILLALKKNKYISNRSAELKIRSYFLIRELARYVLDKAGLYKLFNYLRNSLYLYIHS